MRIMLCVSAISMVASSAFAQPVYDLQSADTTPQGYSEKTLQHQLSHPENILPQTVEKLKKNQQVDAKPLSALQPSMEDFVSPHLAQAEIYTGGIGAEGREEIGQMQHNYPLKLVFVGNDGVFLSSVDLSIADASGKIVATTQTMGPVALAKLAPGKYTATASLSGEQVVQKVDVTTSLRTYHMRFKTVGDE